MKRTAVLIIAVCIIIAASCCAAPSGTEYLTPDNIADAFSVDGQIYYIEQSGSLYAYGNEEPVFTFPTHIIAWSEYYNAFVYLDGKTLCTYSLQNGEVTECAKLKINIKDSFTDYLFHTHDSNVYIAHGGGCFYYNTETHEINDIDPDAKYLITAYGNRIIYNSSQNSDTYILDTASCEKTRLDVKEPIAACIYNDTLVYVDSNRHLYGINPNGDPYKNLPDNTMHIVALSSSGDRLFCAVSENDNGTNCITKLYEIHPDGTFGDPIVVDPVSWYIRSSCKLHIFNDEYVIYATTSDKIVTGSVR